ncbi:Rv2175c family DNA-binding protein [Gleimia hominis]|uniref:Rv2175c family DNA-binding protein n=1 Tax=Gleimia hominis TaxID=595468 RepID=A0ABU3IBJ5_9ACTO|nr:Rv2175c family DNA-binding protein [Gleimia hominis]MDT3767749.1 Rv2175c family DNA-binding protein [Gleimia hominis]
MNDFLTVAETARLLGLPQTRIKQLWARRELMKVRKDKVAMVPAQCLLKSENGWIPRPSIMGTLTMLADAGFSDEEAAQWMLSPQESLNDRRPLDMLAADEVHAVRAAIIPLAF